MLYVHESYTIYGALNLFAVLFTKCIKFNTCIIPKNVFDKNLSKKFYINVFLN